MWETIVPLRSQKPRTTGMTMVMDKGLGIYQFHDLLEIASDHIDFIKLAFGTAGLYPSHILKEKIAFAQKARIHLYLGGTFFEVAHYQGKMEQYFQTLTQLGIQWVEISNGTIHLSPKERMEAIQMAKNQFQLRVITEIGKKEAGSVTPLTNFVNQFAEDQKQGADYIILEGRESGEDIGIYDKQGNMDTDYLNSLSQEVDISSIIWEAPKKKQQVQLLKSLGPDANLGNIAPSDILSVESLRRGLRSDTFFLPYLPR